MADFLTARDAFSEIERIIRQARKRIVLVSPYLQIPEVIRNRLSDAAHSGIEITVLARESEKIEDHSDREGLLRLPGLSLYTLSKLHAKCYLNEQQLVITSLNLYEYSERNWEMGVRFTADEPIYAVTEREIETMIRQATRVAKPARSARPTAAPAKRQSPAGPQGFCIRCAGHVTLNPAAPLCRECWTVWVVFENEEYPEKFCHECGRKADTSKARPRCERCFRKSATALR